MRNFFEVPVHRLMCKDVRMHQILTEPRPLHYKEMRLFLDLLAEVVDRWYEAVAPIHDDISMNHNSHQRLLREVKESYIILMEDDTESVFEERERLDLLFHQFSEMLQSFASVFSSPFELITFYRDILRRLELTNDIIMEGRHGW